MATYNSFLSKDNKRIRSYSNFYKVATLSQANKITGQGRNGRGVGCPGKGGWEEGTSIPRQEKIHI